MHRSLDFGSVKNERQKNEELIYGGEKNFPFFIVKSGGEFARQRKRIEMSRRQRRQQRKTRSLIKGRVILQVRGKTKGLESIPLIFADN